MPELPEVETIRRALEPTLNTRTITATRIRTRLVIAAPNDPQSGFYRQRTPVAEQRPTRLTRRDLLLGATIDHLTRHGKQLAIVATDRRALIVQLGMTGHLTTTPPTRAPYPPHTHAIWTLSPVGPVADRSSSTSPSTSQPTLLLFTDPRRFGLVRLVPSFDPHDAWADLGPDALTIRAKDLHARLTRSHAPIKARLLDQATIAGVGNIYADEALHAARINPLTPARNLTPDQTRALAAAIRTTLRSAIRAGGSTIRDYRTPTGAPGAFQQRHHVYARANMPCLTCATTLLATQAAQRTTVYCPTCQPLTQS